MKHNAHAFSLAVTSILGWALAAAPVLSQSEPKLSPVPQVADIAAVQLVPHGKLIGAEVFALPAPRAEDDNDKTDGDRALRGETLGSISDLVVDRPEGRVLYAILKRSDVPDHGAEQVAIKWDSLHWDAVESRFTSIASAEAIGQLPAFDPEHLDSLLRSGPNDAGAKREEGGTDGAADSERRIRSDSKAAESAARSETLLLASKIADCQVLAREETLGSCGSLFVEPNSGCVALVCVSSGGVLGIGETEYVVPWMALRVVGLPGEKDRQLQVDKSPTDLENAPKLGDEEADLNKAAFRARVYEFYGVRHPAFEIEAIDLDGRESTYDGGLRRRDRQAAPRRSGF